MIYISILLVIIVGILFFSFMSRFNAKIFFITLLSMALVVSLGLMIKTPQMHKKININVIEKIIKINSDGTTTIIETTTTRGLKNE